MYGQPAYYPSPATQTAQQRLQMMESQYPQFAGQQMGMYPQMGYGQPAQQAAPIIKGRPVANAEEANAAMIDFDGSLFVFPDKNNGKVYTKQLGMDGNIVFNSYSLDKGNQPPVVTQNTPSEAASAPDMSEYVKRSEIDEKLTAVMQAINNVEQRFVSGNGPAKGGSK